MYAFLYYHECIPCRKDQYNYDFERVKGQTGYLTIKPFYNNGRR